MNFRVTQYGKDGRTYAGEVCAAEIAAVLRWLLDATFGAGVVKIVIEEIPE